MRKPAKSMKELERRIRSNFRKNNHPPRADITFPERREGYLTALNSVLRAMGKEEIDLNIT